MKAIVCRKYGLPKDVCALKDVPRPVPKDNEVLLKVHAASLNASDFELMGGAWSARMMSPSKPPHRIPGSDVAGTVEAVGRGVKRHKVGDEVYGDLFMSGHGAFAEYTCALEDAVVPMPKAMTFAEASTYPQAAIIALQSLRDRRKVRKGDEVLLVGAGGGMGTFAVQIAKHYGGVVTVVDRGSKLDMLRSLGADRVIDYTLEDFAAGEERYDLILDVAAHRSLFAYKKALKPDGRFIIVGGARSSIFSTLVFGPLITLGSGKKMGLNPWRENDRKDLEFLGELFEKGRVRPVIDRTVPLGRVPEALQYLSEGRARGKVVVSLEPGKKS